MANTKKVLGRVAVGAALILVAPFAFAQTTTDTTTSAPGVPSTGAGGDNVQNALLLGASAAVVAGAGIYLAQRRKAVRM